ncbi:hypothetical protein XENOCAPTIV_024257 [Xenoophorus captivus]|uniref:G-protein coupled receptors family 1 profile domain-containing protein n=1 Tax=Xenoophorus captivus TaxID=1517983 RepID=A0ABV0S068_9TELE
MFHNLLLRNLSSDRLSVYSFSTHQAIKTKMETTSSGVFESEHEAVSPCSRDGDNKLGAQLSTLYYFMFVFSLFGNGLVLYIIHR